MKKNLLAALLFVALPLVACNQSSGGQEPGPGPEAYTPSKVEKEAIDFLTIREIVVEKLEPLHSFKDEDLLYSESEEDFYVLGGIEYCPYYSAQLSGDCVQTILASMRENEWTVPTTPDQEYGYECISADGAIEIDVIYDDNPDYEGTWVSVYSVIDINGEQVEEDISTSTIEGEKTIVTFDMSKVTSLSNGDSLDDVMFYSDYCAISYHQGESANPPAFYNGTGRLYFGSYLEVTVSLGYWIESISLPDISYDTSKTVNLEFLEADEGTLSINDSTVNINNVDSDAIFISVSNQPAGVTKTNGNVRIAKVVVTLVAAPDNGMNY